MEKIIITWNIIISLVLIRKFIMKKFPNIKTYYISFGKYNIQVWQVTSRYSDGSMYSAEGILKIGFGNW